MHCPDIVFDSESWLRPSILSNKVFPLGYVVYCRDCADGYGVFIACRDTLVSHELLSAECTSELVACPIQLIDHPSLITLQFIVHHLVMFCT